MTETVQERGSLMVRGKKIYVYAFVFLLIVGSILPNIVSGYWIHILILFCYYSVLAISWNLLAGYMGQFSLAHHSFSTLGAYTTALASFYLGVNVWVGILLAVIVSAFTGLLFANLVMRLRGNYFALATWAFAATIQSCIVAAYSITRGDLGLLVPPMFGQLTNIVPYYYTFVALVIVMGGVLLAVVGSPVGLLMRSIKDDPIRAASVGVAVVRWKTAIFVLTSAVAGTAGAFYAHYLAIVSPMMGDFSEMAKVIAMVLVGGMGTFLGPLIGALLLTITSTYLQQYGAWNIVIYALVMILVMRLYRGGIMSVLGRIGKWRFLKPLRRANLPRLAISPRPRP